MNSILERTDRFCRRFGVGLPVLLAPMAGASAPALSIAVAEAGGLGACGALLMQPAEIRDWVRQIRAATDRPFQLNTWIPDPLPVRNADRETEVRTFLERWGPSVASDAGGAKPPDFESQCEAMLASRPHVISSVMGLYRPAFVERLRSLGIFWFANVSTVLEAKAAESAGAEVVVVQGSEAGGHRGCFDGPNAERNMVGLVSLVPAVVDAVKIPVVATGGLSDGRGIAAAIALGASAVQIGTGFLRCPEAAIAPQWANALQHAAPEDTVISRVFSGRAGRSLATAYVLAALEPEAPTPAPYPVQRGLTQAMRQDATTAGDVERMQAWAGQSASLARSVPAGRLVPELWKEALEILG